MVSGKQIIAMDRVGWNVKEHYLSRSDILGETVNPAGVGAWFITFRLSAESIARIVCFSEIAERDKSRPYAYRQMPSPSLIVEDTKLKGIFLVTLTIWKQSKPLLAIRAYSADK